MHICLNCRAVFDEADIDEKVIDRECGEYGGYPKSVCPKCGSTEIIPAFQCSRCEEWFPIDEECSPTDEPMCPECSIKAEEEIAEEEKENPYKGIVDPFKLFDRMIEV